MSKYKKFGKKNNIKKGYIVFSAFIIGIIAMSVGYSYYSDTLTIRGIANARYEIYEIEYELNGGTNPENVVTEFTMIDEIPLPIPTKSQYTFDGWYDNEDFSGDQYTNTSQLDHSDVTLYAKWRKTINPQVAYNHPGPVVFDGTNYIDTNVYLYSQENVNKNFIISFNIEEIASGNVNQSTLMNSMNEAADPWPGHVVKISSKVGGQVYLESNSNTDGEGNVVVPSSVSNLRIFRIDNYMYYSFNGGELIRLNDYNGFTDTFDIPVYFGASNDGFGNVYRYFKGTLSDLYVAFLSDDVTVDDFNPQIAPLVVKYQHMGPYTFDGENDYIDTGLQLFTQDNFEKDFEISFNIDSIGEGYVNQATIVNMKNERINTYPGFVYRLYVANKTVKFEAKGGSGNGASNKQADVHSVKIERINKKMYLTINGGTQKQVYDYTNFSNFFDVPLTIGSSLDSTGQPFRYFKGTLSDIVVKVRE